MNHKEINLNLDYIEIYEIEKLVKNHSIDGVVYFKERENKEGN